MRLLILFAMTVSCWSVEPDQPKLPPEVQRAFDSREAAAAKAQATFDSTMAKVNADAIKAMEKAVSARTKSGDLEGAMAGKKLMDGWKVETGILLEEMTETKNVFPIGTWKGTNGVTFILEADGSWSSGWPDMGGNWKVDGRIITLVSNKGNNQTFSVPLSKEGTWSLNGGTYNADMRYLK